MAAVPDTFDPSNVFDDPIVEGRELFAAANEQKHGPQSRKKALDECPKIETAHAGPGAGGGHPTLRLPLIA